MPHLSVTQPSSIRRECVHVYSSGELPVEAPGKAARYRRAAVAESE
jgi:hypothetical protein